MNRKIKIGAFSKLCRVTVKTLRHYEELGLLIPAEIDEWTGYRYYEVSQFQRMGLIVHLKRLGLSLIAAGHYATEFPVTAAVAEKLRAALPELDVLVSTENRDPYTYL